jgi:hypothetical protein
MAFHLAFSSSRLKALVIVQRLDIIQAEPFILDVLGGSIPDRTGNTAVDALTLRSRPARPGLQLLDIQAIDRAG